MGMWSFASEIFTELHLMVDFHQLRLNAHFNAFWLFLYFFFAWRAWIAGSHCVLTYYSSVHFNLGELRFKSYCLCHWIGFVVVVFFAFSEWFFSRYSLIWFPLSIQYTQQKLGELYKTGFHFPSSFIENWDLNERDLEVCFLS